MSETPSAQREALIEFLVHFPDGTQGVHTLGHLSNPDDVVTVDGHPGIWRVDHRLPTDEHDGHRISGELWLTPISREAL